MKIWYGFKFNVWPYFNKFLEEKYHFVININVDKWKMKISFDLKINKQLRII